MMVRFSPPSEFTSGASPIEGSPVASAGGRLIERSPAASIGSALAEVNIPFEATIPRVNSKYQSARGANSAGSSVAASSPPATGDAAAGQVIMTARNSASNRALIAVPSSRGKLAQLLIDVACVLVVLSLVALTAASLLGSVFILLFVKV